MRITKHAGILAAVLYPAMTLVSYLHYPGSFGLQHNWLSDLGNPLINTGGAIFYNLGCLATALLLIRFYLDLNVWRSGDRIAGRLLTVAQIAGIVSSLALILAAIFNIGEYPALHGRFSMLLTIGMTWFLSFSGTALLRHPRCGRWICLYSLAAAAMTLIYGVFFNTPLGEWIAIAMFIIDVVLLTVKTRLRPPAAPFLPRSRKG